MAGIEKLVTNGLQVAQSAIQKSGGVLSAATKPIEAGSEKLTNALDGLAASNSALIKKSSIPELVDETIELLNGCTKKPLNQDLSNLSPKNMVLVHMTDFYPQDGKILCSRSFGITPDGLSKPRTSVHFTVNNISPELFGDPSWADKKFGIIMPSDRIFQQSNNAKLLGGVPDDFMLSGDVKIPSGSFIVKHNPDIPQGKLKVTNLVNSDGITIIETSNENMNETIPAIIKKLGFSTIETDSYNAAKTKNWQEFLNKHGLNLCFHQSSPWGRAEGLIDWIAALGAQKNSWQYSVNEKMYQGLMQFNLPDKYFAKNGNGYNFDYQTCFLDMIEQIKQEFPKEKISYDIDKLSKIIRESKNPSIAMDKIKSSLKLTSLMAYDDLLQTESQFTFMQILDKFILTSTEQGKKALLNKLCINQF